jgi:magnesium-transporting ATPase (P-type)
MKLIAVVATVLIVLRQLIATLHGQAHDRLAVELSSWQQTFVMIVIVAAPIVALVLYWTPWARWGALILWTSMLAGMLFGIYFHFVAVSNDHVSHLPEGDAQSLFVATAILLVPAELAAAAFGFWSWRKLRQPAGLTLDPLSQ